MVHEAAERPDRQRAGILPDPHRDWLILADEAVPIPARAPPLEELVAARNQPCQCQTT